VFDFISNRLGNKILAATIICISLVMVTEIVLRIYFGTRDRVELMTAINTELAERTYSGIKYPMSVGDSDAVRKVLADIRAKENDVEIFVCDTAQEVIWSTHKNRISTPISDSISNREALAALSDTLITGIVPKKSFNTEIRGSRHLITIRPISNQNDCYHCHGSSRKVLGGMVIRTNVQKSYEAVDAARNRTILISMVGISAIIALISAMISRFVRRPVRELLLQTKRLTRGELETGIEPSSKDELGELAASFNEMTESLRNARNELEDWGRTLEVKVDERTQALKQIQTKLLQAEKMASMGRLVAGIAHEINNPLSGILMFASLVRKDERLDPGLADDVDIVLKEAQRCGSIVQGLLEFSRASVPRKEPSSLNKLMDEVLSVLTPQSSFENISTRKEYDLSLPEVFADPVQIKQVFMNLLLNAAKAMPEGGDLVIRTGKTLDGASCYVEIQDTGCGIPEENMGRIFDPFFTTDDEAGTGLGLSISYGIIRNHGGNIDVRSTVGKGTTFTIALPLISEDTELEAHSDAGHT
jgi:two-component system NtrC family sensor kinase